MKAADYLLAVRELQEVVGARLDNVYDAPGGFRLRFRKQGNEYNVIAEPGCRLHSAAVVPAAPAAQSSFVQLLRKELENARVEEIKQINFDRIIAFTFSSHATIRVLVFEQFGKGNAFLLDEGSRVIRPLRSLELGGRRLRKGVAYSPPEKAAAAQKLADEIKSLENQSLAPSVFYDAGNAVAFSRSSEPAQQAVFDDKKVFPTFNQALDDYYSNFVEATKQSKPSELEKQLAKLVHSLAEQKKRLAELQGEEAAAKRAGELIYENYALVETELQNARKSGKERIALRF